MAGVTDPRPSQSPAPVLDYPSAPAARQINRDVRWAVAPPRFMSVAVIVLLAGVVWFCRFPRNADMLFLWTVVALMLIGCYVALRFVVMLIVAAVYPIRPHPLRRAWTWWLIVPAAVVAAFVTARTDWPAKVAFSIYRPQMEALAKQMLADGIAEKGSTRIGIYQFDHVRTQKNGQVSFVATRGNWGYGFLYSSFPTRGNIDDNWTSWSHD